MKTRTALVAAAALAALSSGARASGTFELLALPHSFFPGAVYVSADGSAYCGWNNFYWTADTGYLFASTGTFANVSGDGSTVVGTAIDDAGNEVAATWTGDGGWSPLDPVPGGEACGASISSGYALNSDGTVAVGLSWVPNCRAEAFKWVEGSGSVGLGHTADVSSRATDLSDDGTTAVGFDEHPQFGNRRPALWNANAEGPQLFLGEEAVGEALSVSGDGTRICGQLNGTGFYWSESTGPIDIGTLPGETAGSIATGVADDGTVVGWSGDPWFSFPSAIIWTQAGGIQQLSTYLTAMSVDVAGCYLYTATSISADGHTIGGTAIDASGFWFVPYVVHLPGANQGVADVPGAPRLELGVSVYPNPTSGATSVALSLDRTAQLRVSVIDASGRQIKRLAEGSYAAGPHPFAWDGTDASGRPVSSGAYFVRVEGPGGVRSEKLSLIR